MVMVSYRLSGLVKKGEIVPRYFNPGGLFDEVHLVATNNDSLDPSEIQEMVGEAKPFFHSLPLDQHTFVRTLGYRSILLNVWAEKGARLAQQIKPDLIRCYDNSFNAFAAIRIKLKLGIPVVISLHSNPDTDLRGPMSKTIHSRLIAWAHKAVEKAGLKYADFFIAVYQPIVPYLLDNNVKNYSVVYNAVGYGTKPKEDYRVHEPPRFLCVGRQENFFKEPTHIVEALSELPQVELVLVGTGNLHEGLKQLALDLGCADRCKFIPALPNKQVLAAMQDADVYVFNQISLGISKTVIEAALSGLPIIVNKRPTEAHDELDGDWVVQAEDSRTGYLNAMRRLLGSLENRERLGHRAYAYAHEKWDPNRMEAEVAKIYENLMRT